VDVLVARGAPVLPDLEVDARTGERCAIALADALPAVRDVALARRRAAALLEHPSPRVRAAAIASVRALRDPALLPDLVARVEAEEGRLRGDAAAALRALLGTDRGEDADAWRALLPVASLPPPGDGPPAPLRSERVAVVVAAAGEVALPALPGAYDLFACPRPAAFPPRTAVARCFGRLRAGAGEDARKWLAAHIGESALFEALLAAFDDPEVDTIVLLCDRAPRAGAITDPARLVAAIAARNRWRRVAIHGVLAGDDAGARELLAGLAAATGGTVRDPSGIPVR
jgi:hypothetical protein